MAIERPNSFLKSVHGMKWLATEVDWVFVDFNEFAGSMVRNRSNERAEKRGRREVSKEKMR